MRFSVATLTALLMVVSSPTTNVSAQSVSVSSLVLVDVSNGIRDVMVLQDDDVIDTKELGTELSVRAEIQGAQIQGDECVEFDLDDGKTKRIETASPHFLAGSDEAGENADYSYRLATNGFHTLTVCPSQNCALFRSQASRSAEAQKGCLTVSFETSDGSAGAFFPFPDVANYDVEAVKADTFGIVSGELLKWHTIKVAFAGPPASEMGNTVPGAYTAPSTFADYRLDCTFTHEDGTTYVVPGFYAGNGMVANDRTIGGNIWQCNFVPDRIGDWSYSTVYKQGTNVAQNGGGNPGGFFDGRTGTFTVADVDAETLSDKDFRSKGRLSIANGHWQFTEGGDYFLKIGPDSPQNVMAYADFDFTVQENIEQPYLKSFVTHEDDYVDGQTTWAGGKGTGLIGAINYLSGQGMNVMSLMTLNLDGADGSIFPFVRANPIGEENNFLQYDISKLAQWDVVMSHAEKMGVALHIKLGGDASEDSVDGAPLSENMKLYLREMVARYGHHLAIVWDLGVDISVGFARARSAEIKRLDPYQNPVAVSTSSATAQRALANIPGIDSVTLLSEPTETTSVNSHVAAFSAVDGLVVQSVEVGTGVDIDGEDADHDTVRQESLWGALMAGSAGVQFYFGTSFLESDLTLQDFRSRANLWEQAGYALEFFNMIPFQDMTPQNDLVSEGSYCLADAAKQTIAIYKKKGASMPSVDLNGSSNFEVFFYSPTEGGALISGGLIEGGQPIPSTPEPYDDDGDWAILVKSA